MFPFLFRGGCLFLGTLLPLLLLYLPGLSERRGSVAAASGLVILGAFCQLYVFIIGGQAFPLEIFPGMEVTSSYFDGRVDTYSPSWWEFLLGLGGIGVAFVMTAVGVLVLRFLPQDDLKRLAPATD